jgi:hypothetical protein
VQQTLCGHIFTGDESEFDLEYQQTSQWSVSRGEVPQRLDPGIGIVNLMLTAIWGVNGFPVRFNATTVQISYIILHGAYYGAHGSDGLPIREDSVYSSAQYSPRQLPCPLIKSDGTVFIENQLLHVPQPLYHSDLAPSDFWLFRRIKTELAG